MSILAWFRRRFRRRSPTDPVRTDQNGPDRSALPDVPTSVVMSTSTTDPVGTDQNESESISPSASETSSNLSEQSDWSALPDVPLRLILQMVIANESSAAMRCRLVSRQWNRVALDQLKLHLCYNPRGKQLQFNKFRWISRRQIVIRWIPTVDQLCNSQLLSRMVDMTIIFENGKFNIQPDLIQLNSHLQRSIDVHLLLISIHPDVGLRRLQFGQLPKMRLVSYSQGDLNRLVMRVANRILSTAEYLKGLAPKPMCTLTILDLINCFQQQQERNIQELSVRLYASDNNLVAISSIATRLPNVTRLDVDHSYFNGPLSFIEDFSNLTCLKIRLMPASWIQQLSTIRLPNLLEIDVHLDLDDPMPMPNHNTFQTWLTTMPKLKQLSCKFDFDPLDWTAAMDRADWICILSPPTVYSLAIKMSPSCNDGVDWPLNLLASYLNAATLSRASRLQFSFEVPPGCDNDPIPPNLPVAAATTAEQAGFDPPKIKECRIDCLNRHLLTFRRKKQDGKEITVDVLFNR